MRSGSPDSLDLMVATNYAVMAADLVLEGASGRMVALRGGTYTNVPISVTREGVKRVDVDELYDVAAVPPEGPPRRRQADVPVLIPAGDGDENGAVRSRVAQRRQRHPAQPEDVATDDPMSAAVTALERQFAVLQHDDGVAPLVLVVGPGSARAR